MITDKPTAPDLLPCPFCGGEAEMRGSVFGLIKADKPAVWVECLACGAESGVFATSEEAADAWNTCALMDTKETNDYVQFQKRVGDWILACFGPEIAADTIERNHRFLEEALELVQSLGCTSSEAHQLVDYVYGRDIGEPFQEVGGVMNTLAALCNANDLNLSECAEKELARVWTKVEQIRAKQKTKPRHSPLPQHTKEVGQ